MFVTRNLVVEGAALRLMAVCWPSEVALGSSTFTL